MQKQILHAQCAAEEEMDAPWYIADRSALDALVYAHHYAGEDAVDELVKLDAWSKLLPRLQRALIVLCEPVQWWLVKDDGLRLVPTSPNDWQALHQNFLALLDRFGLSYVALPQEMERQEERAGFVLKHWNGAA